MTLYGPPSAKCTERWVDVQDAGMCSISVTVEEVDKLRLMSQMWSFHDALELREDFRVAHEPISHIQMNHKQVKMDSHILAHNSR